MVSIPNGQLASTSITNLARRDKFLFRHHVRLEYATKADQLRHVLADIKKTMLEHAKLDAGTVKTRLIRFGDAALELEVFAYVPTSDEAAFLDVQQELLLRIMDIVEASGATIAVPAKAAPVAGNFALGASRRDNRET
jgi:MscS family membrane protein